jgi:hypothetical protein
MPLEPLPLLPLRPPSKHEQPDETGRTDDPSGTVKYPDEA